MHISALFRMATFRSKLFPVKTRRIALYIFICACILLKSLTRDLELWPTTVTLFVRQIWYLEFHQSTTWRSLFGVKAILVNRFSLLLVGGLRTDKSAMLIERLGLHNAVSDRKIVFREKNREYNLPNFLHSENFQDFKFFSSLLLIHFFGHCLKLSLGKEVSI